MQCSDASPSDAASRVSSRSKFNVRHSRPPVTLTPFHLHPGPLRQRVRPDRGSGSHPERSAPRCLRIVNEESRIREQIDQVFRNLRAVAQAAGGDFGDLVKLNVYLTDLADFPLVNEVMAGYFDEPYPARAAIGVASLPKDARVEMEGVLVMGG